MLRMTKALLKANKSTAEAPPEPSTVNRDMQQTTRLENNRENDRSFFTMRCFTTKFLTMYMYILAQWGIYMVLKVFVMLSSTVMPEQSSHSH